MKKLLTIALVLLACFSLMAQGSGETKSAGAKEVTLEWWTWDPTMADENQSIIKAYEASHPGVKINNTIIDTTEYWTKLRIQAQQKNLPDVFTLSSGYIEEWASNGLLLQLDDLITKDDTFDKFYKEMFDATQGIAKQDHYYAIPFAFVTTDLFYNKDMFDAAGLSYPTNDWTWDDFLKAAKALTKDTNGDGKIDQWGYWGFGRYSHLDSWVISNNGKYINEKTMTFEPDKNALEAMKFFTDLVLKEKVAPAQKDMSAFRQQDVFPNQVCAMFIDGGWLTHDFRNMIGDKFRWGVVRVPMGPSAKERITYGWPDSYALSPTTANAKEALEFAKYVAGEGIDLSQFMAGKIPSNKALTNDPAFVDAAKQPGNDMQLFKDHASDKMDTSYTMGWSEWRGYGGADTMGLNGAIDSIINGESTFDSGLQKATESINKVLKRYYK